MLSINAVYSFRILVLALFIISVRHQVHAESGSSQTKKGAQNSLSTAGAKKPQENKVGSGQKMNSDQKAPKNSTQAAAIVAGGCFWGVEELIRKLPGVLDVDVGYTGGHLKNPTYNDVKTGNTGHAEAVRIFFDPKKISYEDILKFFFRLHDPTTKNRQGNDIGTQYRSAIFYLDINQQLIAERVKAEVDKSGKWKAPLTTEIIPASDYYPAEDYHQDYLQKNPNGYTCHYVRD